MAALPPLLGALRRMPGGPARGALILVGFLQAFLDRACWERARAWAAVHAANMRKVTDPTLAKQVAKPAGWVDPLGEIERVLEAHRRRVIREELV